MCNVTFDVILFDRRAAIGWLLDVGTVALLVDDAPAWIKKINHQLRWKADSHIDGRFKLQSKKSKYLLEKFRVANIVVKMAPC